MKKILFSFLFSVGLIANAFAYPGNGVIYMRPATDGGFDSNSGTSWDEAKETFVAAMNAAKGTADNNYTDAKDVYIQGGTYTFTATIAFNAQDYSGIHVYGGFTGYDDKETPETRAQKTDAKPWEFENPTIFDGNNCSTDILRTSKPSDAKIIFDGISFENAGMSGASNQSALSLRDGMYFNKCSFKNNKSGSNGGAALIYDGLKADKTPIGVVFTQCYFYKNCGGDGKQGGALYGNLYPGDMLKVIDCVFEKNVHPGPGAAIYIFPGTINNKVIVDGCKFIDNESITGDGGAVYLGQCRLLNSSFYGNKVSNGKQGAAAFIGRADDIIANCVIYNNDADKGSAVAITNSGSMLNCTVANNRSTYAVNCYLESAVVINTAIVGNKQPDNTESGVYSKNLILVSNCASSATLNEAYQLVSNKEVSDVSVFVNPTDFVGLAVNQTQQNLLTTCDWSPKTGSVLIGNGDMNSFSLGLSDVYPSISSTPDYLGNARFSNNGTTVNIGAIENGEKILSDVKALDTQKISVYAADNRIIVQGMEETSTVSVYDMQGKLIHRSSVVGSLSLNVPANIYIVKVLNSGSSKTFKVSAF